MDIDMDGAADALLSEAAGIEQPVANTPDVEHVSEDSFTGLDPNNLPEDLQPLYKNMQADYTRKTQELAEQRRLFSQFDEYGINPEDALNAVGFLMRLDQDPEFAQEYARHLAPQMESPMTGQVQTDGVVSDNGEGYGNLPPELAQELSEMREFREQMYEAQINQEMMFELEQEEAQIRTQFDHYTDDDIERIYGLAYSTEGDLLAAQQIYQEMEQGILNKYLGSKQIPLGATSPSGAPASVPGKAFANLDDAHKAALEVVRNLQ